MKKASAFLLTISILLTLSACSVKETPVFVQRVSELSALGGIAPTDWYGGIVVSESVTEIKRDKEKTVSDLFVREGDDVVEGQKLFCYDTEELQLTLEKQQLQLEQLKASIENHTAQIEKLEKEMAKASAADKPSFFLQIRTNQVEQAEDELNVKTKESEIRKSQHLLDNALVTSPVNGRITAICEDMIDQSGKPKAYITIQKTGSFRIKATLNEMQRGTILEGQRIRAESRLNPEEFWLGTVTLVDYDNPTQTSNVGGYAMEGDEMGSSSRYPFYAELDESAGLLLGQHLYVRAESEDDADFEGLTLGSAFLCFADDGSCFVWAEGSSGKLEKRSIEPGEFDGSRDAYPILSGLTENDYVAFPDESVCKVGAPTTRTQRESGVS